MFPRTDWLFYPPTGTISPASGDPEESRYTVQQQQYRIQTAVVYRVQTAVYSKQQHILDNLKQETAVMMVLYRNPIHLQ